MSTKNTSTRRAAGLLVEALDKVVAALIVIGDLPVDPTDDALEQVLRQHRGVLETRKVFRKRLNALLKAAHSEGGRSAVLALEEAVNGLAWNSADAGYRLGLMIGWADGRAEKEEAKEERSRRGRKLPGEPKK